MRIVVRSLGVILLLAVASGAFAGPYSDALSKCLVSSTTTADKTTLVQWVFGTIALHPDVKPLAAVTPEKRTELNQATARLFERLLTETCRAETLQAVKYEGAETIQASFALLGQVAMRELFAEPKVAAGLQEFGNSIDAEKLKSVLQPPKQ